MRPVEDYMHMNLLIVRSMPYCLSSMSHLAVVMCAHVCSCLVRKGMR